MKHYNLFISHSWSYGDSYKNLVGLLNSRSYFTFSNYSVPRYDPVHTSGTDRELYSAIKNQMSPCSVVLILAGMYASYSKWMEKEINIAKKEFSSAKPIVAIEPWGSDRTSTLVKLNADRIVKWNTDSIVAAIRGVA